MTGAVHFISSVSSDFDFYIAPLKNENYYFENAYLLVHYHYQTINIYLKSIIGHSMTYYIEPGVRWVMKIEVRRWRIGTKIVATASALISAAQTLPNPFMFTREAGPFTARRRFRQYSIPNSLSLTSASILLSILSTVFISAFTSVNEQRSLLEYMHRFFL